MDNEKHLPAGLEGNEFAHPHGARWSALEGAVNAQGSAATGDSTRGAASVGRATRPRIRRTP
jgi:hypothetical protein